jgi:hypothetical protein
MLQKNNFAFFKDFVTSGSYKPHARLGGNSPPSLPGGAPTKQKTRAHRISHRRAHPAHRRREGRKATMAIADQGSVLPTHADREGFSLSPTVHGTMEPPTPPRAQYHAGGEASTSTFADYSTVAVSFEVSWTRFSTSSFSNPAHPVPPCLSPAPSRLT